MAKSVLEIITKLIKQGTGDKEAVKALVGLQKAYKDTIAIAGGLVAAGFAIKQVFDATVGTLVSYADQVRRLSNATGTSAEDSSRLIQVMDDMKVSYDELEKAVQKNGKAFDFSIDGIAKMSDQYKGLATEQEKAAFMQERFGKNWISFVPVMQKGGDAIRNAADEVENSLVLTQRALVETRLYEIQVDKLTDAWTGFKIQMGQGILGILDGSTKAIQANAEAIYKQANGVEYNTYRTNYNTKAQKAAWEEAMRLATEQYVQANAMDTATQAAQDQAQSLKDLSEANKGLLDLIGRMQSASDSYSQQYQQINSDMSLSDEERKIKLDELAAEYDKKSKEIILNLLQQKLAQDGLTTDELNFLLMKGQAWGIYSGTVVTEAQRAMAEVDALNAAINSIPSSKDIAINFNVNGAGTVANYVGQEIGGGTRRVTPGTVQRRAGGGPVNAGQMYMVGEKGPEMFVPKQSGSIVPSGGGAVSVYLSVNSPMTIMDEQKVQSVLLPMIITGIQTAKSQGKIK